MITRLSVGGPLDGMSFGSRYPEGFVLVNKNRNEVRVYDEKDGLWKSRPVEPLIRVTDAPKNIRRAMAEFTYDVVTFDASRMGEW